jgi:hypothetical protein
MKTSLLILALLSTLMVSCESNGVTPDFLDNIILLLRQPFDIDWRDTGYDRPTLASALKQAFDYGEVIGDMRLCRAALSAMGDLGWLEFEGTILYALNDNTEHAMATLARMPSSHTVPTLIAHLNDEHRTTRLYAAAFLGNFQYYDLFPGAREYTILALQEREKIEPDDYVLEAVKQSIERLEKWPWD